MKKKFKGVLILMAAISAVAIFAVTAFASGVKLSLTAANTANGIRLEWSECEGAYYYEVYRKTGTKGEKLLLSKVQDNFYVDTETSQGKTYNYTVMPVFTDYSTGTESDSVAVYRLASVSISHVSSQRNGLYIKWKGVKNAKGYRVYRKVYGEDSWLTVGKLGADARDFTDEEINPGQRYVYTVKAFMGEHESAAGNEKIISYLSYPAAKAISNTQNGITLSWESESEAKYYIIYKKTGEQGTYAPCALLDADYTEYEDKAVASGQTYYYYICAANAEGNISSFDRELSVRCVKKSVITAAVCAKNGIKLVWSRSEGCQGYAIFKKAQDETDWKLRGILYGDSNLTAVDSKVKNKENYTYTVRAFYGKTLAAYDDEGATMRFYAAPQKLTCKADAEKGNTLKWAKDASVRSYAVYRKDAKNDWAFIGFCAENSFVDKTAKAKEKYAYTVEAYEGSILHSAMADIAYSYK